MKNITKLSTFAVILFAVFAVTSVVTSSSVFAVAPGAGDGGCCGGDGDGDGGGWTPTPTPTPTPNPTPERPDPVIPVCTITASPASIVNGNSSTLSWTATRANTASINQGIGPVSVRGTKSVSPTATITYTMTVRSSTGNTATCSTRVAVTPKPVTPPTVPAPTCVLSVTPATITVGGNAKLSWTSTNSVSGTIDQTIGVVDPRDTSARETVTPAKTTTYTMTVKNSAGATAKCVKTVTVKPKDVVTPPTPPKVPAPTCVLSATPATIVKGSASKLTWTSTNALSAVINQAIGIVDPKDTTEFRNVTPAATITYTMTVKNSAGVTATCAKTITVKPKDVVTPPIPPKIPAPTCVLKANKTTVAKSGDEVVLSWTSMNSISGVITPGDFGVDPKEFTAVKKVYPTKTTVYTMTVVNSAQKTDICKVTVTVPNTPPPALACTFTASPTSINRGQSTTLRWTTDGAATIRFEGITSNLFDGSVVVSPTSDKTYKLIATKGTQTIECLAVVNVETPNNNTFSCPNNVTFNANPSSIREGDSTTLTWTTRGVDTVSIDGVNSNALNGSESVSPRSDTTYNLRATKGSNTISCPVTVSVDENNGGGGGGGSSSPKCSLKISDNKISLGERVTLKWDTTRATEVTIKDNHGKTLIDTDDKRSSEKKDLYDGEITLRPERDTTYTLVAEKGSKDRTCKVEVDVEDTIVVTQIRDQQPLVSGISLTSVPYTGFEAGPFMTSVFYTLLAAWALYMAYVLVGRRNGMNVSAFTPATVASDIVSSEVVFPSAVTAAPVFYQAPVAVVVASTATVGYAAHVDVHTSIEAQAHAANVLLSSDAISYFVAATANEDRASILSGVLAAAKASYPSEDGWVVVSADRMVELASKY